MAGCNHAHDHSADVWTKANAALEFSAGLASNLTFFSWLFFSELNGDATEAEHYCLAGLAVLISLYFASASAYCHKQLNHNHQPEVINSGSGAMKAPNDDAVIDVGAPLISPQRRLSAFQKFALFGDACDHTVDATVPITVGMAAVSIFIFGNDLIYTPYFKGIVALVAVFSAAGSYASMRTCRENMKKRN